MRKPGSKIATAIYFLRYVATGRHWKGHGVHSPFVFDFINNVLFDKATYPEYDFFQILISSLRDSDEELQVHDLGDDSHKFRVKDRKVADLAKTSSVPSKYGKLLFRITRYYKPKTIIELGTSIGISTLYLAKGHYGSKILTVEGNRNLCDFAKRMIGEAEIDNITIENSAFGETINNLSHEFARPQMVFIDGDHRYDATLKYFTFFEERMKEGILIIDDIYWSAGMRKAWKKIAYQNKKHVTIDLFRMGIILIRESITPGHYVVRY